MKNGTTASMPVLERQQGSQEEQTECPAGWHVCAQLSDAWNAHTPQKAICEHSTPPLRAGLLISIH